MVSVFLFSGCLLLVKYQKDLQITSEDKGDKRSLQFYNLIDKEYDKSKTL